MKRADRPFDDWDDWSVFHYMEKLHLSLPWEKDNVGESLAVGDTLDNTNRQPEEGRPPPHIQRKQNIVDVCIKCLFCLCPTQTAGDHQICVLPCGLVCGYSCMAKIIADETETCPMCGENHMEFDVTKLDILPEQMATEE
ncbi:uncharacterized protein LOC130996714 [Salvia miltiorrhiza]|uniref:uncharacterized protein LOC130996714 n=1 Tax=Salvia miltiorrhiza TaxID=226208 RepID=UPI0025AB9382|nr:uncharacterized protein LOC130996714 [Salvia miltiorrhiza]